jgi:gliding motility-associated-like protein
MKYKYLLLIIASLFIAGVANCQHQLYFENFEGASTFMLNDTGAGVSNKGNNMWIINNTYLGGGIYPKTINEDSTFGGTISFAPTSHYLHIYDSASTYKNDNYNPADSSNRFAHMITGVCTKNLTNINFNFFYVCQGSATAYGEVYYSIDGGPWTQTGSPLYNNRYKWQYATVTNPAFTDVEDLRFGFKWHNDKATGKDTSAMGIDDASIFGTYDSIAHPIKCTFSTLGFDSCLGGNDYIFLQATINDSTCNATWDMYMSNGKGTFPGAYAWYSTIGPSYGNDIINYWYLQPPVSFNTVGECYKFKLVRTSYPYLSFTDSICFPFDSCPGTITTLQPAATLDSNAVCAGSTIDVPFFSSGIYGTYNTYFAQLIDSIGSTAKIDTIGNLPSNVAYNYPPGDIVSTIPTTVPAGCHYYIRVVSSTPNRKPAIWGPFCIQHCDIFTNNQQSVLACLKSCKKQPQGYYDSISFNVHKFDSLAHYKNGNKFEVQLIQFMNYPASFAAINTGLFGTVVDTTKGKIYLHVPCPDTLFANGINPGVYYMRIIADSSNFSDSSLGSLVHLTIGEPADSMYLTVSPGSGPYCAGSTVTFNTNPDDEYSPYNSTYTWWETDKTRGTVLFAGVTTGYLGLNSSADTFEIKCQENNNGCLGKKTTLSDTIIVLGPPSVIKKGPLSLCEHDTGTYSIPFLNNTNYSWKISAKAHADTSNNVLKIRFDTTGKVRISVVAFNACFTDSAVWTVNVIAQPKPVITAVPSASVCAGVSVTLTATGGTTYTWSNGTKGASITITPTKDTAYWVTAANKACTVNDTIKLISAPTPTVNATVCVGDTVVMNASGAKTYIWSPTTGLMQDTGSTVKGVIFSIGTYKVVGTAADGCKDSATVFVNPANRTDTISGAVTIDQGQSTQLYVIGGTSWYWSPGAGLSCDSCQNPVATPQTSTVYTVIVKNANGCTVTDTVSIDVLGTCTIFVPKAFSPNNPSANNILYARGGECLVPFDFIVYDRWGNKVFETHDVNIGWNGEYRGQPMNTGTYVYYVGGTTPQGKTVSQKGNVSLVR